MIRAFQHLWLLLVVSSLLAVPAARAGVFKGHPYHDPHCSAHYAGGIVVSDAGDWGAPCAGNCGHAAFAGVSPGQLLLEPPSSGIWYGAPGIIVMSPGRNCPPATNALLRVWVNDSALISVNGTRTKPQRLAGANRGSRIFSLTGLQPSILTEAVVRAQMTLPGHKHPTIVEKKVYVQAGGHYEARITDEEFAAARAQFQASAGLLALYDFKGTGPSNIIRDVSGVGTPLDLFIHDTSKVDWHDRNLRVRDSVLIQSGMPAEKIRLAVQRTNEITIETWITPHGPVTHQHGPARVVGFSSPQTNNFNLLLAQQDNFYDVRLRTSTTDVNKLPSLSTLKGIVRNAPTHVVVTRDCTGATTIFLDGRPFSRSKVDGLMSNWEPSHLVLANELNGNFPWFGTFHRVAIYGRELSEAEVQHNFERGHH